MADQVGLDGQPLVLSPDAAPATAAVHPPTDSYGPGSADEAAGTGSGDLTGVGLPPVGGTGDRGGTDRLAARS